jgi:hypothetical protein
VDPQRGQRSTCIRRSEGCQIHRQARRAAGARRSPSGIAAGAVAEGRHPDEDEGQLLAACADHGWAPFNELSRRLRNRQDDG